MKNSLRILAQKLNVSESYLSQINTGKRPASQELISRLHQLEATSDTFNLLVVGSSPTRPTKRLPLNRYKIVIFFK